MFLRAITKQYPQGSVTYLYLLEGYRDQGRVRQRVVANLGRADLLAPHLKRLTCLLRPYLGQAPLAAEILGPQAALSPSLPGASGLAALTYGPVAVARRLWEDLGLGEITRSLLGEEAGERAFVLVAHRLCSPGSEHALAWWLEEAYVADSRGRRLLPEWERRGRVRVAHRQLARYYRTLDRLVEQKEAIEQELYGKLLDLFGLKVDLVFYDLTSTYFEGAGPEGLARRGHSRDHRPRDPQVVVGVVMASGWPIASYVFEGNRADKTTVQEVIGDVRRRFEVGRVIWVTDRGMVSAATLAAMAADGSRYLVGIRRRRNPTADKVLAAAQGPWQALPGVGEVAEVGLEGDPHRYFVIRSPERLAYEREMREQSMARAQARLERLGAQVRAGRIKAPEKIGARAQAILKDHKGGRYFSWELTPEGEFRFRADKLAREERLEGTYILATNDEELDATQAVAAYKELQLVEKGFRHLKDVLEARPIHHRAPRRVRGHLFVAHLALVLGCALERALRRAGLELALESALAALRPVRLVSFELDGRPVQVLTKPTPHAQAVLKAVGLGQLRPPRSETA